MHCANAAGCFLAQNRPSSEPLDLYGSGPWVWSGATFFPRESPPEVNDAHRASATFLGLASCQGARAHPAITHDDRGGSGHGAPQVVLTAPDVGRSSS